MLKQQATYAQLNTSHLGKTCYDYLRYLSIHILPALCLTLSLIWESSSITLLGLLSCFALLKLKHQRASSMLLSHFSLYFSLLWLSSYWLIYCLMDFIDLAPSLAALCLSCAFILAALILCLPSLIYHGIQQRYNQGISLALLLISFDYWRESGIFAMPWLQWLNHSYHLTISQAMIASCGSMITAYLLLRIIETIINVGYGRYDKDAKTTLMLLASALAISCYNGILPWFIRSQSANSPASLAINLIQVNHDHHGQRNAYLDWEDYLQQLHLSKRQALNITAEGVIQLDHESMPLTKFKNMSFLKNSIIGVNYAKNGQFTPMLVGTNQVHGNYRKQHLVPFGEYFPLPSWLMQAFDFYQTHHMAYTQAEHINLLRYRQFSFYPLICYDLFFTIAQGPALGEADAIVAIAENTWYRDSLFQSMFLRAAKMRALESDKPVLLVMNRGPSAHISAIGKLDKKLNFNQAGTINTEISKKTQQPYRLHISDWLSPTMLLGMLWLMEIYQIYRYHSIKRQTRNQHAA